MFTAVLKASLHTSLKRLRFSTGVNRAEWLDSVTVGNFSFFEKHFSYNSVCLTALTMGIHSFVKQVNLDMYPKSACFVQANLILMKFFCLLHIFECDAC